MGEYQENFTRFSSLSATCPIQATLTGRKHYPHGSAPQEVFRIRSLSHKNLTVQEARIHRETHLPTQYDLRNSCSVRGHDKEFSL
jgi:hypothetical protein